MRFDFTVSVEVERTSGPFASRDEIEEQIIEMLEQADGGSFYGDSGGEYETVDWEVTAQEAPRSKKKAAKKGSQ